MTIWSALLLGIVQGLTEFLPVSSSGHLVILHHLLADMHGQELAFDVMVHLATLIAVVIFFREEIMALIRGIFIKSETAPRKEIVWIIVATVPTGIMGVLMKDFFEEKLARPHIVAGALLITAAILLIAHFHGGGKRIRSETGIVRSLIIGIAQGFAITPGISRSGATIATGMISGLVGEEAARFSFLISIPAILGAVVLNRHDMLLLADMEPGIMLAGFLGALISGYAALGLLMMLIKKRRLPVFAVYCILLSIVTWVFL